MAETLEPLIVLKASSVNLKATGTTDILGARTGKKFFPFFVRVRIVSTALGSPSGTARLQIGTNASSYSNVLGESALGGADTSVADSGGLLLPTAGAVSLTAMKVNVTAAETGSGACAADIYVVGYYID